MKTLTWQEAYSNLILDDHVEEEFARYVRAKEYRKLNFIKGKVDPEENKKKPPTASIRVIESEKYKKLVDGYLNRCSHPKDSTNKKTEVCPY